MVSNPLPPSNQNLISQTPAAHTKRPRGFWKQIILDCAVVVCAVAVSASYSFYLEKLISFWALLGVVSLFALASLLSLFFSKHPGRRFLVIAFEIVGLISFFVGLPLSSLVLAVVVGLLLFVWGEEAGRGDLKNNFEIRFFKTARAQVSKCMTALVLMGILLYVPIRGDKAFFLSESVYQRFFSSTMQLVQNFYPEINLHSSIDELSKSVALLRLKNDPAFNDLSRSEQDITVRALSRQFIDALNSNLGVPISPKDSLETTSYNFLNNTVEAWRVKLGDKFAILWGVAIFFIIRGLASIFSFAIILVGFALFQLLLALRWIQIGGETRMRETIEFS